jgi:hypothetical protein
MCDDHQKCRNEAKTLDALKLTGFGLRQVITLP